MNLITPETLTLFMGAIGTAMAAAAAWIFRMGLQIGTLKAEALAEQAKNEEDRKLLNTMASYQRRRGMVGALAKGIVEPINAMSIQLTDEWRRRLEPLKARLASWYATNGYRFDNQNKLFWELEENFGDEIVQHVCIPYGLHDAECLAAAVLLCRETMHFGKQP